MNLDKAIPAIKSYLLGLQSSIVAMLESEDGKASFLADNWSHQEGGGGLSRVLEEGQVIEKAGVNFSHVQGFKLPPAATKKRPELIDATFQALGVSVVVHPRNPYVPTSHMNVRCIIATQENDESLWWFGGGYDLTPYYGFDEDCVHWHRTAKLACDPYGDDVYPHYKKWCDDYFYLAHRDEPRGIGGLFFDDLNSWGFEKSFAFMQSIGNSYIEAYQPIVAKRKNMAYNEREREFQLYRRGRYVEFNLLYDRGTLFGLQSGGRTESILMSLPPHVSFKYDWHPKPGTAEEKLYQHYLKPKSWV